VGSADVQVEGRTLRLSNPEKILYPAAGFTKAHVVDYYVRVSHVLLPHLRDRALTLKRYPDGVEGGCFYEKRCPPHRPPWVRTATVRIGGGSQVDYCLANDLATLVWAANLADLELHVPLALAQDPLHPTVLVFDLDPGAPADLVSCGEVALLLARELEAAGLQGFAKVSGSKGLQVYVPLNAPQGRAPLFDDTKTFARALAVRLERAHPDRVVSNMRKSLRTGKVFVDWSQNDAHKTTVCVYSLRARERPLVSMPVTWAEVTRMVRARDPSMLVFEAGAALRRVQAKGDLFAPVLRLSQRMPADAGRPGG